MIPWNKGKKHSIETKNKISISRKGKLLGKDNPSWKGDNVKYAGIHNWLRKNIIKTNKCNLCHNKKETEFALRHGKKHLRRKSHYFELCLKCHKHYDNIGFKKGRVSYWKGKKQSNEFIALRLGYGTNNHKSKLNYEDVSIIRNLYKKGEITTRKLSKIFNVSSSVISSIINYKTWRY